MRVAISATALIFTTLTVEHISSDWKLSLKLHCRIFLIPIRPKKRTFREKLFYCWCTDHSLCFLYVASVLDSVIKSCCQKRELNEDIPQKPMTDIKNVHLFDNLNLKKMVTPRLQRKLYVRINKPISKLLTFKVSVMNAPIQVEIKSIIVHLATFGWIFLFF